MRHRSSHPHAIPKHVVTFWRGYTVRFDRLPEMAAGWGNSLIWVEKKFLDRYRFLLNASHVQLASLISTSLFFTLDQRLLLLLFRLRLGLRNLVDFLGSLEPNVSIFLESPLVHFLSGNDSTL